jgi:hypothetical protein
MRAGFSAQTGAVAPGDDAASARTPCTRACEPPRAEPPRRTKPHALVRGGQAATARPASVQAVAHPTRQHSPSVRAPAGVARRRQGRANADASRFRRFTQMIRDLAPLATCGSRHKPKATPASACIRVHLPASALKFFGARSPHHRQDHLSGQLSHEIALPETIPDASRPPAWPSERSRPHAPDRQVSCVPGPQQPHAPAAESGRPGPALPSLSATHATPSNPGETATPCTTVARRQQRCGLMAAGRPWRRTGQDPMHQASAASGRGGTPRYAYRWARPHTPDRDDTDGPARSHTGQPHAPARRPADKASVAAIQQDGGGPHTAGGRGCHAPGPSPGMGMRRPRGCH